MDQLQSLVDQAPHTLIIALVAMIVLDYISGLLRALYEQKGNSKTHYKGVIKKLGIILGVLLGAITDMAVSDGVPIFTTMISLLFIAGEGLSIIENLGVLGLPMPQKIKDKLEQIKQSQLHDD